MAKTTELGKFISTQRTYPSGDIVGYRVRSPKTKVEKYFGIKTYGSLEKALEEARKFAKEKLKVKVLVGDSEEYLKLRNTKKDLSAARFAKYLNDNTDFVPERGTKFTTDGIKQVDQKINFKSDVRRDKRIIPQNIKDNIFSDYQQQLAKGERNLSVLGRKYFPDLTRDAQSNVIRKVLVEKGEDISRFKKVKGPGFDPVKEAGKKRRTERLGKGKKAAGFSAGRLSDKLLADIRNLNQDILKMSDEEILANKKIINSMKVNANVNNLNKGIITFDKYNDLSPKELVKKIKDRAKQGIFWQPEHISSVKGEAKNIYYPNNLQAAPGNIGSFMENFKKIAKEDPNNPVLNEINTLLKDYNLTVRDPNTKVRLGFTDVIEVDSTNKTSNIVTANADSIKGTTNLGNTLINNFIQKVKSVPGGCRAVVTRALGGPIDKCEAIIKADPEKAAARLDNEITATKGPLKDLKEDSQKLIRLYRGEGFKLRSGPTIKEMAKTFGVSEAEAKKKLLSGQWFTSDPVAASSYTDKFGKTKFVDVTPKEFTDFKKYVERVNKTKSLSGGERFAINTTDKLSIVPRYKLKEFEKADRLKSQRNIFRDFNLKSGYVDRPEGVLSYDSVKGGFVDPAKPDKVVTQSEIKQYAIDNPMEVKVGEPAKLPKPNKSVLKTVGKTLAAVGAPLPTALLDGYFIGKQVQEGKSTAEIASNPLNWLGLATMSPLTKAAGLADKSGKLSSVLRLGLNPGTISGITRFAGLPGLAISTAVTAYDQYNKYKNQEGFIYKLFNKEES